MFILAAIGFSILASVVTFALMPSLMSLMTDRSSTMALRVR